MQKVIVSGRELAEVLGLSSARISQLAATGHAVRISRGKYDLLASVQNYLNLIRDGDSEVNATRERGLLYRVQRELKEIEVAKAKRELIPAQDVEREWAQIGTNIRQAVLSVPAKISLLCVGRTRAEIEREITNELKSILRDLATGGAVK